MDSTRSEELESGSVKVRPCQKCHGDGLEPYMGESCDMCGGIGYSFVFTEIYVIKGDRTTTNIN